MSFGKPNNTRERRPAYIKAALIALAAFFTLIWSALLTAGLGHFSLWIVLLVAAITGLGFSLWLKSPKQNVASNTPPGHVSRRRYDLFAAVLAVSTLAMTLPPGEFILGGWDPGVYVQTAVELSRQGTLQFDHPDIMDIPREDRPLIIRDLFGTEEPFGGMRILPDGRVSPQFYHAYPSLMACAVKIGGLRLALHMNPLLNIIAILAFYAMVTGWTGSRRWGLAGAVALAVNPTQLWQARFCTAEMLTQTLILTGFVLLFHWCQQPKQRLPEAVLGGMALGLAQLTRYDTLIVLSIALPVLLCTAIPRDFRKGLVAVVALVAIAALHAWAHQKWIAPYYSPLGTFVVQGLMICVIATVAVFSIRCIPLGLKWTDRLRKPLLGCASIGWLGWMMFNWLIRPTLHQRTNVSASIRETLGAMDMGALASALIGQNSRAMLYVENIFGPTALALALCGIVVLLWTAKKPAHYAWVLGGMGVTLLLTWRPYNDMFMMWVSRRYIPVVIPLLTLGMVASAVGLTSFFKRHMPRVARFKPGVLIFAAAIALMLPASRHMVIHRDWDGLIEWFENVDELVPKGASLYTDHGSFAAPLRFIWQHHAYDFHHPNAERTAIFFPMLERAAQQHGSIYFISETPPPESETAKWAKIADIPLEAYVLRNRVLKIPDSTIKRGGEFSLYKLNGSETP